LSASWIARGVLTFAFTVSPVVVLALRRKAIGRLNAAAWIAMWGLFIPAVEHGYFGMIGAVDSLAPSDHARVHMIMGLAYWPLGAMGLAVAMGILLREGHRVAWYLLLVMLAVGGGLEIILNGPTGLLFQHGFASNSNPGGMSLFAYPVAWITALVISYRPIFAPSMPPHELRASSTSSRYTDRFHR
jgi:hypothetical protein